ncbi:hypothetical protein VNO77_04941 [Canavalia gladiata]|uniref:Uncharacterized protein n=1 Tax=Canavalia gladiata TaxID=3824 RepID=A0AAN9N2I0_CANGL
MAQTLRRQTEALGKKRNAKATAVAFVRSKGNYRASHMRRRRNFRNAGEIEVSNENEDMNDSDAGKDSSSGDEQTETRPRGRRGGERETQIPQHSATIDADGTGDENIPEVSREINSPPGTLAWGRNGHRSHTRANGKIARNSHTRAKLVGQCCNSEENNADELDIHLMLVTLDEQRIPSLQRPYLRCRPTSSVKGLCQYVAFKTALLADEVELCLVEEPQANIIRSERTVEAEKDKLRVLGDQETLAELNTDHNVSCGYLLLAYKMK